MALSLGASLRAQLLDVAQKLLTVNADGAGETAGVKAQLLDVLAVLALYQTDVRTSVEQAVTLLDTIDTASALALVTRAFASLPTPPPPTPDASSVGPVPSATSPPPTAPPTCTFPLPTELITHILDLVHSLAEYKERQQTMVSAALVSRAFYRAATVHLSREVHITNPKQFLRLADKFDSMEESCLVGIRILTLDFDLTILRQSIADDEFGRTWLAPAAQKITSNMEYVRDITFGSFLITSVEEESFEDDQFYGFLKYAGLEVQHMPVKRICVVLPPGQQQQHLVEAVLWDSEYWAEVEQFEIVAGDEVAQPLDPIEESHFGSCSLTSLIAPRLRLTLSNLLWLLNSSPTLRFLDFTLMINKGDPLDNVTAGLDQLFPRLELLEHLRIRLESPENWTICYGLVNPLMTHIARLSKLQSLALEGDLELQQLHDRGNFAEILAPLNITELSFRCRNLFSKFLEEGEREDLMTVLRDSPDSFPSLHRLTIFYEVDQWLPVNLPLMAEDCGIELRLCVMP